MKRIAISLVCPLIGALLMTSCLKDDEETVKSSDVALLSFAIKDLKTIHTIQKEDGTDSTYTVVMSGKAVEFVIDQAQRIVYNSDSIAYGIDVTQVLVELKADGEVCYLKADGTTGSVEDSIDFTNPVTFRVTSYDELFSRDYRVSINVHQSNPRETTWTQMMGAKFPAKLFVRQKAFVKNGCLLVIGVDDGGKYHTASTMLTDGTEWTTTECLGIAGSGLSAVLVNDVFYLATDAGIYSSVDAITWAVAEGETLLPAPPIEAIRRSVAMFSQPLNTNGDIIRTLFVATPENVDTCAEVWTKLSTEAEWIEIGKSGNKVYGCPNLENLTVIHYAENMYAFGGNSLGNRKEPLEPFGACYESRDNGVTWKVNEKALSLPVEFGEKGNEAFSAATDGEYVWVMWYTGEVWRGRWNGIKQ